MSFKERLYKGEKLIQGTSNDKKILEFYRKLKKNEKRLGEFLEEQIHEGGNSLKSIVATTDSEEIKAFEEGLKQFSKTIAKPFEKMPEAMPYFNHKSIGTEVIQIGDENCGNVVDVLVEYLKTGKLRLAEPSSMQGFETVAAKCGGGKFSDIGIPRLEAVLGDGDIAVIYGAQKYHPSGRVDGHYFVAVKVDKKVHLLDGQSGEFAIYDVSGPNKEQYRNFIQRNYIKFMYTRVGKIKK